MKSIVLCAVFLLTAGLAQADWGFDPMLSTAWLEYPGYETVSLVVHPDGGGRAFTQAQVIDGTTVDATVYLELINYSGMPMVGYPAEDMWLESGDGGLVACALGTCAEAPTDASGRTTWTSPLRAGGHSQENCRVLINGASLLGPGLLLHFNSPDLNGDLAVNLVDVSHFAGDYFGIYDYRSDLFYDSMINISDLSRLIQGLAASCP